MKSVLIKGKKREAVGKKSSKLLRTQGNVPCVLYGGEEPLHFHAEFNEFRKVVYTPNTFLIDLDIEGTTYKAIVQDTQWHPVEELLLHVDFLLVKEDKPVKIDVPVVTVGLAKGIKAGGKLISNLRKLKVKALAKDLPDTIEIDVKNLAIGQNIKVSDLNIENLEFLDTKTNVIVGVAITRAAKSAAGSMASEEEEAEEPEAGEGGEETSEATE
ncbi:MAG: 50S ribosomal protein L25/general stress protein Ctc [Prolixibacteraceae bacterium]|nr:50S ribosomal protein L25/general stress protein Ctc [Prolixibacteraceae bacterium]MBN2774869.1 50S ribosomal protein L25/general stress protein Ctc [Prolixibacteraceae bacterium]